MKTNTLAGITVFHPDFTRLNDNLHSISNQVEQIIIINNSPSINIDSVTSQFGNITVINNEVNVGVATALNQVFKYAVNQQIKWVITLDQDSICKPGLVDAYLKYTSLENLGLLSCIIEDRNFSITESIVKEKEVDFCITSGSFCSVDAYLKTGGFDDEFFIDCVDFDYCLNLRKIGYKIYQIPFCGLLHEVGHAKEVSFFGKKAITYNEPPFRQFFMARNRFLLAKKYPSQFSFVKEIVHEMKIRYLIKKYEDNSKEKIKERKRGIREAKRKWH